MNPSMLGRIPNPPDVRDANYPASMLLAAAPSVRTTRTWRRGPVRVNQGQYGYCVGFAGANWKQATPIRDKVTDQTGIDDYMACKAVDGSKPGDGEGTYDRALMKVYQDQGIIDRYLWATTPPELKQWILEVGTVLVGVNWYGSMFKPDAKGLVTISGSVAGGHEFMVRAVRPGLYGCSNTWGASWGLDGEFWISEADLNRLVFDEGGDACCAVEKQRA